MFLLRYTCYMNEIHEKVKYICDVQHAVEAAMQAVINYIYSSHQPSSEQAHAIIDEVLTQHGCESPEYHIVAGGEQAVEPHEHGFGVLKSGVPIVIDIYPRSKETGYFADMTRTICIGDACDDIKKMYQTVYAAQQHAINMIKPGVLCADIQKAVENYFEDQGYRTYGIGTEFTFAEGFVHGVGHGVSDTLHDRPRIGRGTKDVLSIGDVITIEPGLYYKDIGAVRIEDMFLVTQDGYDRLSNFSYQFEIK